MSGALAWQVEPLNEAQFLWRWRGRTRGVEFLPGISPIVWRWRGRTGLIFCPRSLQ
ncbi:hypothetical protein Scep_009533 [Stephania cephalantha]|uniref:Uncharacterized protein n=1 Tax=Stephania cephalantha TaxID=152367 RepID=A0AAP0PD91_9MAGN